MSFGALAKLEPGQEGGLARRFEAAWRLEDGNRRWIAWSSIPLEGEGPARVLLTGIDVTDRKRSEERFRGIVAMAPDAIISLDEEHRIAIFNEAAEEMFGYSRSEVIGEPLDILLPARYRTAHRRQLRQFADGSVSTRRMRERSPVAGLRRSGEEFPAEAAIEKTEVDGSRILTVLLRDVTVRYRAEDQRRILAEASEALASTLDYADTLSIVAQLAVRSIADCCIVDILDENGSVRRVAVAAADPAKAAAAEMLRHYPKERPPPFAMAVLQSGEAFVKSDVGPGFVDSIAEDENHRAALAAIAPASFMSVPLLARGKLLGALVLIGSASARRYELADLSFAEEIAHRAAIAIDNARSYQAAQEAILARDQILSVVAHDLRSPLTAISIAASALRPGESRAGQRAVETIVRSSERMAKMIEDLLDAARIDAGKLTIAPSAHRCDALVAEAVDASRALAAPFEMSSDINAEGVLAFVDRDRLMQVFSNLIGNALKFSPANGTISVGCDAANGSVRFWVRDDGPGIDPAALPHLFDRFWQGKRGDRRGVGLGLWICRAIVELHQGRIWAESSPGKGSTFFFTVPVLHERQEAAIARH